jgi:hypothetical protein
MTEQTQGNPTQEVKRSRGRPKGSLGKKKRDLIDQKTKVIPIETQ